MHRGLVIHGKNDGRFLIISRGLRMKTSASDAGTLFHHTFHVLYGIART